MGVVQNSHQPLALYALRAQIIASYKTLGYIMPEMELDRIRSITNLSDAVMEASAVTSLLSLAKEREALENSRRHQDWLESWRKRQDDQMEYGDMS